jgi:hypothetical protein
MAVRLIREVERLEYRFREAKIWYKRVPQSLIENWTRMYTRKGVLNNSLLGRAAMQYAILGWEGFVGEDDKPFEFKPERVDRFIDVLPGIISREFAEILVDGIDPADDDAESASKNSQSTPISG